MVFSDKNRHEKVILKNHMTSDSNKISANKRLLVMLSDADFGESDRVEMCHMASTQSSLGLSRHHSILRASHTLRSLDFNTSQAFLQTN